MQRRKWKCYLSGFMELLLQPRHRHSSKIKMYFSDNSAVFFLSFSFFLFFNWTELESKTMAVNPSVNSQHTSMWLRFSAQTGRRRAEDWNRTRTSRGLDWAKRTKPEPADDWRTERTEPEPAENWQTKRTKPEPVGSIFSLTGGGQRSSITWDDSLQRETREAEQWIKFWHFFIPKTSHTWLKFHIKATTTVIIIIMKLIIL